MTSAPNHLRQLSGNSFRIFSLIFLLILLQGCFLFKKDEQRPQREKDRDTTIVDITVDTVTVDVDTLGKPKKIIRKDVYNMAIMLPFAVDSRFMYSFDFESGTSAFRPLLSLEMYEGMLVALKDLEKLGLRMNVRVYDTRNDPQVVQQILAKPEMKNMDLIIGPLFSKTLAVAAPFAKANRIFLVSPLLPKVELSEPNPYYINATATTETHGEAIAIFAKEKYPKSKIFIVTRDDEGEKRLAEVIKRKYNSLLPSTGEVSRVEILNSFAGLSGKLSTLDTNIIVVPTFNKFFTKTAAATLSGLAGSYPIISFGMPNWFENVQSFEENRVYDQMASMNLHFTTSFFTQKETDDAKQFRKRVKERFGVPATEYIYKGYDLMMFMGKMLNEYGISFGEYLDEEDQARFEAQYIFQPKLINELDRVKPSNIEYYENKYVPIIRFIDYQFIQVN